MTTTPNDKSDPAGKVDMLTGLNNKTAYRAGYALVQVLFDKLADRERRIAELEVENAQLIRNCAERLFKKERNDD